MIYLMPFSASSAQGDYSSLERPSRCIRATGAKGSSDKHVSQAVSGIAGAIVCCCNVGLNPTPTRELRAGENGRGRIAAWLSLRACMACQM